jgi:hypothetical protein
MRVEGTGNEPSACMPELVLRSAMAWCLAWTRLLNPKSHSFTTNLPSTGVVPVQTESKFKPRQLQQTCWLLKTSKLAELGTGGSQERARGQGQERFAILTSLPWTSIGDAAPGMYAAQTPSDAKPRQGGLLLLSSTFSHLRSLWIIIGEHLCRYLQQQHQHHRADMSCPSTLSLPNTASVSVGMRLAKLPLTTYLQQSCTQQPLP